jgi:hypothetical protein
MLHAIGLHMVAKCTPMRSKDLEWEGVLPRSSQVAYPDPCLEISNVDTMWHAVLLRRNTVGVMPPANVHQFRGINLKVHLPNLH